MIPQTELGRREAAFDAVAVATSRGGLRALGALLSRLPADFSAAVLVVQHHTASSGSLLSAILAARSPLPVREVRGGEAMQPGVVYVAPPDRHLQVSAARVLRLSSAPKVSFARPSADVLFESAAGAFGPRALGVVLTGNLHDGARGVRAIKAGRGRVIVQDEATSEAFGMPRAAIATGCVDFVLPLERIASALVTLVMVPGAAELFKVPIAPWAHLGG
ncbi:MAG TPA: chemotaxis protein CheB [Polyangiaceae bacterium]|nr:chemotaxis protein CheB [Polyangiaceae bacterium]